MTKVVYPGTFDPLTYGHLDIIVRGATIFDHLIVAIARNVDKKPLFTDEGRVEMARELVKEIANVSVDAFAGMTVDYVRSQGTRIILRGMRTMSDFENEFQLALSNRGVCPEIETVFLMTSVEHSYLSSHRIKEVARVKGDVGRFVPPIVAERLKQKFSGGT